MATPLHTRLTYDDLLLFPYDGKRHELLDGDHFMTPSPNTKHQRIVSRLNQAFSNYLDQHPIGQVFPAPYDVVLSPHDVCEPDLVFVASDRLAIITPANIQGAPSLVVEVLSDGTRKVDEKIKRARYEHFGIPEYWIVDPELEIVKVFRTSDRGYLKPDECSLDRDEALTCPLLPGFRLSLTTLFA
jgi:Uma2 family endonuclease